MHIGSRAAWETCEILDGFATSPRDRGKYLPRTCIRGTGILIGWSHGSKALEGCKRYRPQGLGSLSRKRLGSWHLHTNSVSRFLISRRTSSDRLCSAGPRPRKARAVIRSRFLGLFKRPASDVLTGPASRAGPAAKLSKIVSLEHQYASRASQPAPTSERAQRPVLRRLARSRQVASLLTPPRAIWVHYTTYCTSV
jgi:hypothetical protein